MWDREKAIQELVDNDIDTIVKSYNEMNDMYKAYTKGSNSFSHILKALMIPYKNRPTQRYLVKHPYGGYHVRTSHQGNWVVVNERRKNHNDFDSTY